MDALEQETPPDAQSRLIGLAGKITSINDPLDPNADPKSREVVLARWQEWWSQRYDMYTAFEGTRLLIGTVTETRYFRWLNRILTLDFGVSTRDNLPILGKLAERLPVTLLLSLLALLSAYAIAVPLGMTSAVRQGTAFDKSTSVALFVMYSLPTFWVAMLLLRYLGGAGHLDLFPAQGLSSPGSDEWPTGRRLLDAAHHLVLPVLCLSYVSMAVLARYQRAGMLQVIDLDFMRVARAKGLTKNQVLLRHGLRNGVIPVIAMMGLQLPYLIGGSVVVELIFGIPGVGFETFEAIRSNDQPWLIAVVTVTAAMTLIGVVAADVLCAVLDPRIMPGQRVGRTQ